jgi:hypothetical protein
MTDSIKGAALSTIVWKHGDGRKNTMQSPEKGRKKSGTFYHATQ